jgi:hypothetical protein
MQGNDGKLKLGRDDSGSKPSLRAIGSRECAPDDRLREGIDEFNSVIPGWCVCTRPGMTPVDCVASSASLL